MSRTAAAGPARARPHSAVPPSTVARAVRAVAGLALRSTRRGGTVVLLLVAGLSALVAWQYRITFATSTDIASLQVLATNPAIRTLFGAPVALDDPGGFTVWRTGTFAALLTGLWTLLAAVRHTRGEEDAGRWALLLAGRLRMRDVVAVQVAVVAVRGVLTGAGLLLAMVLAGADVAGSLRYGACVAAIGVLGAGAGATLAQVLPSRSAAAGAGGAAAAASLLLRMLADGVEALSWLAWVSPLGLLALVQPYAADRTAPLGVLAVAAVAACAAAVAAAAHRDLGAGLLAVRDERTARTRLLGSLPAFALRRALRGLAGWGAGLSAYFLLVGALTVSLTDFLEANPVFAEMAAAAGFAGLATVEGFAASMFALLPVPLGAYVAGRLAATAAAETERRLTPVLALPVPRLRWLRTEAAVAALAATLLAVVCGVAFWAGAVLVDAPLSLADAVAGALNPMPVTLLCLAAATLALGLRPSAVLPVGVLPAVGGYVLQVLAESLSWPREVLQLAPSSHVAAVPATAPDWAGAAGMLAVAAVLAGVGAVAYRHRDLHA